MKAMCIDVRKRGFAAAVGYGSKFALADSVTSDTGTNDILRLLASSLA